MEEDKVIWVGGATPTKALASSISRFLAVRGSIEIRAIGVQAVNQAVKAICISSGYAGFRGKKVSVSLTFANVPLKEGDSRTGKTTTTGITFKVEMN